MQDTVELIMSKIQASTHLSTKQELKSNSTTKKCLSCNDTYWVFNENNECVRCSCYKDYLENTRLKFANIPEPLKTARLKDVRFDKWQRPDSIESLKKAFRSIKIYLENFDEATRDGLGLYIYSQTKGSGKTHIMACICNELMERGYKVKFSTSGTILQEIRNTYQADTEYSENKLLNDLYDAEILAIDDFGQERATDWVNEKFYNIINNRYLNKKITLFTSNESIKTLAYDERITSRVRERTYEIHYAEESIREHIAEKNNKTLLDRLNA